MSFVHLSILMLGGLLVAIPIILHMVMRQRPTHQVFPAMRFLSKRSTSNTRKLRLRQWLLLGLRCLMILLFAAALARPSVASSAVGNWAVAGVMLLLTLVTVTLSFLAASSGKARSVIVSLGIIALLLACGTCYAAGRAFRNGGNILLGDRDTPVAAAIVIDTSVRMDYRFDNETRLERAKRMANWLVRQLPDDSDVAILDSRNSVAAFSVDLGAAITAIDSLETATRTTQLTEVTEQADRLLGSSQQQRKELYVFTDLTAKSWGDKLRSAANQLDAAKLQTYIIDVGVEHPINTSISKLELSTEMLANRAPVEIEATIERIGGATEVTAKLLLEGTDDRAPIVIDGEVQKENPTVRGQKSLVLDENGTKRCRFKIDGLEFGTHHGYLELTSADGLATDDRRYFTVQVREPWSVLIITGENAVASYLMGHLAPLQYRNDGRAKYQFSLVSAGELASQRLDDFSAVCLLDPPPLPASDWQRLQRYARRGGGLAVFLGRNASPISNFNTEAARSVLPALLRSQWKARDELYLAPTNFDHPILSPFRNGTTPWDALPVFRHWLAGDLEPDSNVILTYGNQRPALLERRIEAGCVVMMTSPISDADRRNRPPWNLIPIAEDNESWPFLILSDQIFMYLVRVEAKPLNYSAGQTAEVSIPEEVTASRYQLFLPNMDWQEVTATGKTLQVSFTESLGPHRVYSESGAPTGGFSVNLETNATRLDRIDLEQLQNILGSSEAFQLVREQEDIVRQVDEGRLGREFYPFVLVVLVVTLALEHLLSNRFYRKETLNAA